MTDAAPISVLVVEDDRYQREGVIDNLTLDGFRVFGASSASEAICLLQEANGAVDLGLLDLELAGSVDGVTLLQRMRSEWPDIQVIILSGKATLDLAVRALNAGAYSFLYKPCDPDHLATILRQAHEKQRLFRRNESLLRELHELRNTSLIQSRLTHEVFPQDKQLPLRSLIHEMKNQLQLLTGTIDLTVEDPTISEEMRNTFIRLSAVTTRMIAITRQAGDRSRSFESTVMTVTDLSEVINSVLDQMDCIFRNHMINIETTNLDYRQPVFGNSVRLEQLFANLFLNAVEAISVDGTISISIERQLTDRSEDLLVTIIDSGPGIAPDLLDTLFDLDRTDKTEPHITGRGLGLYLCRAIVEHHGGTITAHNNTAPPGAVFELRFPLTGAATPTRARLDS